MSEVGSCKYQPVNKYVGNEPIEEDFFAGEKEWGKGSSCKN